MNIIIEYFFIIYIFTVSHLLVIKSITNSFLQLTHSIPLLATVQLLQDP